MKLGIIGLRLVGVFRFVCVEFLLTEFLGVIAFAGASATIASDALMNPFDGEPPLQK